MCQSVWYSYSRPIRFTLRALVVLPPLSAKRLTRWCEYDAGPSYRQNYIMKQREFLSLTVHFLQSFWPFCFWIQIEHAVNCSPEPSRNRDYLRARMDTVLFILSSSSFYSRSIPGILQSSMDSFHDGQGWYGENWTGLAQEAWWAIIASFRWCRSDTI